MIFNQIADYLKDRWNSVKRWAKEERSKEILTFAGFVVLSTFFWALFALNEDGVSNYRVPLRLENVPDKAVFISEPEPYVDVRVRDKGMVIASYYINRISPITVDFSVYSKGRNSFSLNASQIESMVRNNLRNSSTLISVSPDTAQWIYSLDEGRRLPLIVQGKATVIPQCVLSGDICALSDSVTVYAPASVLKKLTEVKTESFEVSALSDSLRLTVKTEKIPGARIIPDSVEVIVPVEELTLKTLTVPVIVQNTPRDWSVLTFPSVVNLTCMMPVSKFAEIKPESFLVSVDFNSLRKKSGTKAALQVLSSPENVRNIQLSKDSVEYIIEQDVLSASH